MCSGRIDLKFILRAFINGQDGVFVGACRLNDCNYVTHGNYDALGNVLLCKKIMTRLGLNPERLTIKFMSSGDGILLSEAANDFSKTVMSLGPLGISEGLDPKLLKTKLTVVNQLVPYMKLVERERLRISEKSEKAYLEFFESPEMETLFDELFGDKITLGQILQLLGEKPMSTSDIAGLMGLSPSEVSRHMNSSSRQGLVRYDVDLKCYALA